MPRSLGNTIADSLGLSLRYAQRLQTGVNADNFARFAAPGGQQVESNHPAFIFGHLSLYAQTILNELSADDLAVEVPASFNDVFSKDATCADDAEGTIYPAMEEVLDVFQRGYENVSTALVRTDDAVFQQPNPTGGRLSEIFPTLGSMHAFYVGGHMMVHMGQLSAWRRMQGLAPA